MLSVTVDLIAGSGKIKGKQLTFFRGTKTGTLLFHIPLRYKKEHEVVNIDWEQKSERSVGKAAAGAVVGGVLTGGVGLVAGAALGGKKKDISTAIISFVDDDVIKKLYVRCNNKEFEGLLDMCN